MSDDTQERRSEFTQTDRATFFESARRFSQRLRHQPDLLTDDDIHEVLGEEVEPAKVRSFASNQSAPQSAVPATPNPPADVSTPDKPAAATGVGAKTNEESQRLRKKANSALHRRLFALERILGEVETAIAGVIAAPGRSSRLRELDQMQQDIDAFRTAIGWPRDAATPCRQSTLKSSKTYCSILPCGRKTPDVFSNPASALADSAVGAAT